MKGSLLMTCDELMVANAQHYEPLLASGIVAPDVRHIRIGGVKMNIEQLERAAQTPLVFAGSQRDDYFHEMRR